MKSKGQFDSFDAVDHELEILDTTRKLHYERFMQHTDELKNAVSPMNLALDSVGLATNSSIAELGNKVKSWLPVVAPYLIKKILQLLK